MKPKRSYVFIAIILILFNLTVLYVELFVGPIQYREIFEVSHEHLENQKIRSELQSVSFTAESRWFDVPLTSDCMGGHGYLVSVDGIFYYEFGSFSSIPQKESEYKISYDTIRGHSIKYVESATEFGFQVENLHQKSFFQPWILHPSVRALEKKEQLIEIAESIEFRK